MRRRLWSAQTPFLHLPDSKEINGFITDINAANAARSDLFGRKQIIAARLFSSAAPCLCVLVSPGGKCFSNGRLLRLLVEEQHLRSTERLGATKIGYDCPASLELVREARERH